MSNRRKCTLLNKGSGQRARPKFMWKGYRPPRSAKQRHLDRLRFHRLQKQLKAQQIQVKGLDKAITASQEPELKPSQAVLEWAEANGITVTPWQESVIEHFYDTEGEIKVG